MGRAIRQRLQCEDGISLVEMLIAMVVLGVVLSATASTLISSFVAIGSNENRTRATALANEELENLRAIAWDDVGFYDNDTFPAGAVKAKPTVILGPSRPAGSRAPLPSQIVSGRGPDYTVVRTIEWVENTLTSSSTGADDEDYKRLVVTVTWRDGSGQTRSLDVETLRSPTPLDAEASDFVLSLYEVAPDVVLIDENGHIASGQSPTPLQFSALTSAEAKFLKVKFMERGNSVESVRDIASTDGVTWNGSYQTGTFPNGEVVFTFVAERALPYEQEVIGRRVVRFLQPMAFTTFVLTPSGPTTCLADGAVTPSVQVDVHVNGIVAEDTVSVAWNGQTLKAEPVPGGATLAGTAFRATIPAGSYTQTTDVVVTAVRQQTDSLSTDPPGGIVVSRQAADGTCS